MRIIIGVVGYILIGGLVWYLFLKPHDYQATFKAKTFPGAINQSINYWNNSLTTTKGIEQEGLLNLVQELQFGDTTHVYNWVIIPDTDASSTVKVYVKDIKNSLKNKIAISFTDTDFEKRTRKTLLDFMGHLNAHNSNFKVQLVGEEQLASNYCARFKNLEVTGLPIEDFHNNPNMGNDELTWEA